MNEQNTDYSNLGGSYICFSLGNEKFALPLLQVKEVIADIQTTPIPQTPAYFKGIMNLRGQVISVIDLRAKLNIVGSKKTEELAIIILDFEPFALGVVVDTVDCVTTYEGSNISQSLSADTSVNSKLIIGVAKEEHGMILILDLKAILNAHDYKAISGASDLRAA